MHNEFLNIFQRIIVRVFQFSFHFTLCFNLTGCGVVTPDKSLLQLKVYRKDYISLNQPF
jgi:hypothetical protein